MDSSTLDGFKTKLKDNDIVSIIPIIHGGSSRRIQFSIMDSNVELFDIANDKKFHIEFLDELRLKHPSLILQSINSRFILGINHVKKILSISLYARKNNSLLSKKIETDILLRFAITTQISSAIEIVGQKPNEDFLIIAIGKKSTLGKIYSDLKSCLNAKSLSKNNQLYLKRQFKISNKQLDAVYSKYPLEDLLVEKATILL
jgi:tRNA threonylcarbamoyladenosine modification (KEOPS) complex Cgi121 subunit